MRYVAIGCCLLTLIACKRESREVRPSPAVSGLVGDAGAESTLLPGQGKRQHEMSAILMKGTRTPSRKDNVFSVGTTAPAVMPMAVAASVRRSSRRTSGTGSTAASLPTFSTPS